MEQTLSDPEKLFPPKTPVYFTATSRGIDGVYSTQASPHPFPTTVDESGGGFDNSTGKYTAPKSGIYFFAFSLERDDNSSRKSTSAALLKNEVVICHAFDEIDTGSLEHMLGCSATISVKKDDILYMKLIQGQTWQSVDEASTLMAFY